MHRVSDLNSRSTLSMTTKAQRQHALREVVGHCIYGVDKNPLAVELCKTALWIETVEPGRPLSFLDHRIREGDSLIGVFDLTVVEAGIPDAAYSPKTGDDKAVAADLKRRNRDERKGQHTLGLSLPQIEAVRIELARAGQALGTLGEDDADAVARKAQVFERRQASTAWRRLKDACDLWTAAFFAKLEKPDSGHPERIPSTDAVRKALAGQTPQALQPLLLKLEDQHLFHWPLEFPEVFDPARPQAERGFDVVLGNPPWGKIKLREQDFFINRDSKIANATGARRKKLISALANSNDPVDRYLYAEFQAAKHAAEAKSEFARGSGRWPLTAVGEVNTYALFSELSLRCLNRRGRAGVIVPTGIATDESAKSFFQAISVDRRLASLYDFQTGGGFFNTIGHAQYKFCMITMTGAGQNADMKFGFFFRDMEHFADKRRHFILARDDFVLFNPNTRTCPIFRTGFDAELTKKIYRRVPVLIDEARGAAGSPWGVRLRRMFDKSNDTEAGILLPASDPPPANVTDDELLPVIEGSHGQQFNHRYATYENRDFRELAPEELTNSHLHVGYALVVRKRDYLAKIRAWGLTKQSAFLGFRRVARNTDERTVIACLMPRMPSTYGWILCIDPPAEAAAILCGIFNSTSYP